MLTRVSFIAVPPMRCVIPRHVAAAVTARGRTAAWEHKAFQTQVIPLPTDVAKSSSWTFISHSGPFHGHLRETRVSTARSLVEIHDWINFKSLFSISEHQSWRSQRGGVCAGETKGSYVVVVVVFIFGCCFLVRRPRGACTLTTRVKSGAKQDIQGENSLCKR